MDVECMICSTFQNKLIILFSDFFLLSDMLRCAEGNPQQGVTHVLRNMLALISSQSW